MDSPELSSSLCHVCLTLNHLLSAFRMNVIITSKFLCLVTMRLCLRVEPTRWTPPAETTEWVHWFQLLVSQRHLMDRCFNAHPVVVMVCGQLSSLEQVGQELLGQARCPFESRQSNVGVFAGEMLKHTHYIHIWSQVLSNTGVQSIWVFPKLHSLCLRV